MDRIAGVVPVLPIPFDNAGDVDWTGLTRIALYAEDCGVDGVAFGFGSEWFRLTEQERAQAIVTTVQALDGRIPVLAACHGESAVGTHRSVLQAKEAGASVAIVTPPSVTVPDPASLREYFQALFSVSMPLIIQDAPQWSGVRLEVSQLVELCTNTLVIGVKIEDLPTWPKIRKLREELGGGVSLLTGHGGLYLLPELYAGADGVMPSAAYPQLYSELIGAFHKGQLERAWQRYQRLLPFLIASSSSLDSHIWFQKELLRRRGVIEGSRLRNPGREPDTFTRELVSQLLALEYEMPCS